MTRANMNMQMKNKMKKKKKKKNNTMTAMSGMYGAAGGGSLKMVEKDGKKVPFFAADGKGKMAAGGMVPKTKGYFKGGKIMMPKGSAAGGVARGSGAASPQAVRKDG